MLSAQARIAAALLFAATIISTSLFLRANTNTPTVPTDNGDQSAVVVTTAPERKPLPELDQNNDGVPDWQEALQVTTPLEITGEPDENYTPPETLTEQFSLTFFQNMVRAKNYGAFGAPTDELAENSVATLVQQTQDTLLTEKDIIVSDDVSLTALSTYGNTVADILLNGPQTDDENEAEILLQALRAQDAESLKKLDAKIAAYTFFLETLKEVPVPSTLRSEHLYLLNSIQAVQSDIAAMRNTFQDPMFALIRIKRYQEDTQALLTALQTIYTTLERSGVVWTPGSPAYVLTTGDN